MTDIIFSFDTEDFTCCRAADGILEAAEMLREEGIRGCFNLVGLLARNEAELFATLTEAQKETFEKIKDCWMEMNSINEVTIFTHGFKLGLRLTAESLISSKAEQEPITE